MADQGSTLRARITCRLRGHEWVTRFYFPTSGQGRWRCRRCKAITRVHPWPDSPWHRESVCAREDGR